MKFIIFIIKKLFLKAGFTVLRGDLRKKIKNETGKNPISPRLLKHARVMPSRESVLKQIPKGGTIVEVGVAYGYFSQILLDELQPHKFIAIDTFGITPKTEPWGVSILKSTGSTHLEYYSKRFNEKIISGQMELRQGLSWEMLEQLPDKSIDYIYLDADHSYESVSKDINALKNKIKEESIIQFNDYTFFDQNALLPYGVPKAVQEFMLKDNYEMLYLCLHPEGFYDVVLKKATSVG